MFLQEYMPTILSGHPGHPEQPPGHGRQGLGGVGGGCQDALCGRNFLSQQVKEL